MDIEKEYLLKVLSDFLNNKESLPENVDWQVLLNIAESQQVTGIIFSQCKSFIPQEILEDYKHAYFSAISANTRRKLITEELQSAFLEKKCDAFIVKGPIVSRYYSSPLLRTMGDTDIVARNRSQVDAILSERGFVNVQRNDEGDWTYSKDGIQFEIHDKLVYSFDKFDPRVINFCSRLWDNYDSGELNISYHFVYLIIHLFKHFSNLGIGIRQFLDVAFVLKNEPNLDFEYIKTELTNIGLADFAANVFALINRCFGVKCPLKAADMSDELFCESVEYMCAGGVFGLNNGDSSEILALQKVARNTNGPFFLVKIKFFFAKLFPPYSEMSALYYCKYLKKCKLLLPFAWVHRFFYRITSPEHTKNFIDDMSADREKVEAKALFLQRWGV